MRGLLAVAVVIGTWGVAWAQKAPAPAPAKKAPVNLKAKAQPSLVKPAAFTARDWGANPAITKDPAIKEAGKAKLLQTQGMTAYKAGNYDAAVKKFAAAMESSSPSPELIYHAAQAYRLKGERAKALELYEQYLEHAPDGSAAPVCRWYAERLRDTP